MNESKRSAPGPVPRWRSVLEVLPTRMRDQARCSSTAVRWLASGIDARLERDAAGMTMLTACCSVGRVNLEVEIDIAQWCSLWFDGASRLAFESIDPRYLRVLFERDMNARATRVGPWSVTAWRALEIRRVVHDRWCTAVYADNGLRLSVSGASKRFPGGGFDPASVPIGTVPIEVTLSVGRSRISLDLFSRVQRGDLLLMQRVEWRLRHFRYALGTFRIEGNSWIMNSSLSADLDDGSPLADDAGSRAHDTGPYECRIPGETKGSHAASLGALPVEIEFVLDRIVLTLADLQALHRGVTFPITRRLHSVRANGPGCEPGSSESSEDAGYFVEIRANGRPVGTAELVALDGDTLAAQVFELVGCEGAGHDAGES